MLLRDINFSYGCIDKSNGSNLLICRKITDVLHFLFNFFISTSKTPNILRSHIEIHLKLKIIKLLVNLKRNFGIIYRLL